MITRVEALNFRCLRYVNQPLRPFSVLVGANASGKSTFLDVILFIRDVVAEGPSAAIRRRTDNVYDMLWQRQGASFELAIEATLPDEVQRRLGQAPAKQIRYELKIGFCSDSGEVGILGERLYFASAEGELNGVGQQRMLFPAEIMPPARIYDAAQKLPGQKILHKRHEQGGQTDTFYREVNLEKGKGWIPSFRFGPQKSALGNLPDDGTSFPAATWLKQFLTEQVQQLVLNSQLIRVPSRPGQLRRFLPDGGNLPWVIEDLRTRSPAIYAEWLEHVRMALPEIESIRSVQREEDKHRYLVVRYSTGVDVPSWVVSDGTLRFLALTLLAYLDSPGAVYLIEEPENGIHPRAVEPLYQSLSSVYESQVLVATHSPIILGLVSLDDVLCFAKLDGATDVVSGSEHPALKDWKHEADLGLLFATGVLG